MKKIIVILSIAIFSALSATEVLIWVSSQSAANALEPAVNAFEMDFPEHKIKIVVESAHLAGKFEIVSDHGPDIILWAHDVVGKFVLNGKIQHVDPVEGVVPSGIEAFTFNGKVWGYPYSLEAAAIIYNKKLVNESILKNEKNFIDLISRYSISWDLKNFYFTFPFLGKGFSSCQELLNNLKSDAFRQNCLDVILLLSKNLISASSNYDTTVSGFLDEKYPLMLNGAWCISDIKKKGIDYGIIPLSHYKFFGKPLLVFVGTQGFFIRKNTPNLELAKTFIEQYALQPEAQIAGYAKDPRVPSIQKAIDDIVKNGDEDLAAWQIAIQGIPMPNNPSSAEMWEKMAKVIQALIEIAENLSAEISKI